MKYFKVRYRSINPWDNKKGNWIDIVHNYNKQEDAVRQAKDMQFMTSKIDVEVYMIETKETLVFSRGSKFKTQEETK